MSIKTPPQLKLEEESNALSDVTNFIAQEIYKLAVIRQYPNECSWILNLSLSISNRLAHLYGEGLDSMLDALKNELVDLIVFGATKAVFEEEVCRVLRENDVHTLILLYSTQDHRPREKLTPTNV
ncbi:hypothetical protein HC752_23680 [Vibrio sp. S9_S30]|uniref:hypothetical protein n=1 Tax=Vibrio sp. S9_S30 TaxID=2720226 RepID=UPI001680B89A|nr:hypothetical protein [Vibrio sp. S9_S30]MBD1559929.1 hypothetical protein [Vibrio sp. S9_S30]